MLTPMEIKDKRFQPAGRNSYKSEDVDLFFDSVTESYEQMFKENAELIKRVSMLAERLEQYKKDEDSIKSAVLTAQRAADKIEKEAQERSQLLSSESEDILAAAKAEVEIIKKDTIESVHAEMSELIESSKEEAELILTNAKKDALDIISEAENEAKSLQGAATRTLTSESILYDMLKKEVSEFKNELMARYKTHIELITQLPELAMQKAKENIQAANDYSSDELAEEEPQTKTEEDDDSGDECVSLEFDESDPDIEFIEGEDEKIEGVLSIDDFVNESETKEEEESAPAPKAQDEYVENTDIPFDVAADNIEIINDNETPEDTLDVNDFISSFEEPLHNQSDEEQKKKGFSINFSKLSKEKQSEPEVSEDEPPAADMIFDSRAETGFKLKNPVVNIDKKPEGFIEDELDSTEAKENDDETKSIFSNSSKENLKKRFSVIKMDGANNTNSKENHDTEEKDDDADDNPPSIRSIFKKKK